MEFLSTDFRKISQYKIPRKNPSTGKRRWLMRTNGRTDTQLMVPFVSYANTPETLRIRVQSTPVRIKYISDKGQFPIQYRYRKRGDQELHAWFLVSFSLKPLWRANIKCVLYFPLYYLFQTLCIVTKYLASYDHVMAGMCTEMDECFHVNCPLQPPGF